MRRLNSLKRRISPAIPLALSAAMLAAAAAVPSPAAAHVFVRFGFGVPVYAGPPVFYGPPAYYYAPPPVYYYPPPVTYYPPPAGYTAPSTAPSTVTPEHESYSAQTCREYQTTTTVGGVPRRSYGTACLQPDGSWRIVN
ncbi:MAG TPA: hypothetical protein VKY65_02120 [Alphaproteobacteria bacterium]|nr:hypothetical protein [Alphaproteobacteria bacterium]